MPSFRMCAPILNGRFALSSGTSVIELEVKNGMADVPALYVQAATENSFRMMAGQNFEERCRDAYANRGRSHMGLLK